MDGLLVSSALAEGKALEGIPAADGFAVGRALRLTRHGHVAASSSRTRGLREAILRVRHDLQRLLAALPREEAELFEPEACILDDIEPQLLSREAEGQSEEDAIFAETSCGCTDLVIDLRERLLSALEGATCAKLDATAANHESDLVLLADVVTPSAVAFLPKQVVAVVAAMHGPAGTRRDVGPTSHAAILARGRGLPLVYLAQDLLSAIPNGAWLVVDSTGTGARISVEPGDAALEAAKRRRESTDQELLRVTRDSLAHLGIALEVNVASAHDDIPASADGVGLVRTEMMFSGSPVPPREDDQLAALLRVASKAHGAPVVVRLFDAGGDKPVSWLGGEKGSSRGIARLLAYPRILATQLRALERARERADVRALLPFVRSPDEVKAVREGLSGTVPLGAMVESPDAVQSIDSIVAVADFISIGTNDLTATAVGAGRTTGLPLADPRMLVLVHRAIAAAHAAGREATICGEMAGDERGARIAVGLGADAISVAPARAAIVRRALARTTLDALRSEARGAMERPPEPQT